MVDARSHISEDSEASRAEVDLIAGRYRLKGFVHETGTQRAYLARDTRLERDVLLSLVRNVGPELGEFSRIRREAQALGRLGFHPHISSICDIGEEGGEFYLATPYIDGESLAARLEKSEKQRLPAGEALRVADEICQALIHAHGHLIVHRAICPANIWFNADGTARLAGFGLTIAQDSLGIAQPVVTEEAAPYVSPEQVLGREADERSDLYSLGAVLYEMVTGRPPFRGEDVKSIVLQQINSPPLAPSCYGADISPALERLIMQLLSRELAQRTESAVALRHAMQAVSALLPRATGAEDWPKANPLDRLTGNVFVGREREMVILRDAVDESLLGRGQLLFVCGEPGVGKTRITDEVAAYAKLRQVKVLVARSYEGEDTSAFRPWLQIARSFARSSGPKKPKNGLGNGSEDILERLRQLDERPAGPQTASLLEPEQARYDLFDGFAALFKNAAKEQPLLLVFDDLHWADRQTMTFLRFFVEEIKDSPVLVIGTYRDVEANGKNWLRQMLNAFAQENLVHQLFLHGLNEHDVARFIEMTAGLRPAQPLVSAVHQGTGGNPFFMIEVVRLLAADGRLEQAEGLSLSDLTIPWKTRELINRRIGLLPAKCRGLLSIAAVIGQEFDLEILERASGLSASDVTGILQDAVTAHLLTTAPWPLGRYRFSHALVCEALYDGLSEQARHRVHRRIGEALEDTAGDNAEEHLDKLAHHFFEAISTGGVDKAVDYCQRAGGRAAALHAYEDAASYYKRALQALSGRVPDDLERRYELLLGLGETLAKGSDEADARDILLQAATVARILDAPEKIARAALGLNRIWAPNGIVDEQWIALLEEALTGLGREDSRLRALVLSNLAIELYYADCYDRRAELSREAVEIARRLGDPTTLARTLYARRIAMWTPENIEERLSIGTEIVDLGTRAEAKEATILGHIWREIAFLELGDTQAMDAELEIISRLAEELRQPHFRWNVKLSRAMRALMEGRFDEVEGLAEEALRAGERIERANAYQAYAGHLFWLRSAQGRLAEFEDAIKGFIGRAPTAPDWLVGLAYIYCELGRDTEAREVLEAIATNNFEGLCCDETLPLKAAMLACVCAHLGDIERARHLYKVLAPFAGRNINCLEAVCLGSASYFLGILAATMKHWEKAAEHFEHAIKMNDKIGARPWLANSQHAYAEMLVRRGHGSDRMEALDLLGQALEMYDRLGMKRCFENALELKFEIQQVRGNERGGSNTDLVSPEGRANDLNHAGGGKALAAPRGPAKGSAEANRTAVFQREGEYWTIGYGESVFRLKDKLGLRYIGYLLRHPVMEFFAPDLVTAAQNGHGKGSAEGSTNGAVKHSRDDQLRVTCLNDAGEMLDVQAKRAYKHRLAEIKEELEEAKAFNDSERASELNEEYHLLAREIARAVGLGGRRRKNGSHAERARVNVTQAIKGALRTIAANDEALGRHLATSIKTGTFCVYIPDPSLSISWAA